MSCRAMQENNSLLPDLQIRNTVHRSSDESLASHGGTEWVMIEKQCQMSARQVLEDTEDCDQY